jgi:hypothetical protein
MAGQGGVGDGIVVPPAEDAEQVRERVVERGRVRASIRTGPDEPSVHGTLQGENVEVIRVSTSEEVEIPVTPRRQRAEVERLEPDGVNAPAGRTEEED